MKYKVNWNVDKEKQKVHFEEGWFDDRTSFLPQIHRTVYDLKEKATQEALIELGWTPPDSIIEKTDTGVRLCGFKVMECSIVPEGEIWCFSDELQQAFSKQIQALGWDVEKLNREIRENGYAPQTPKGEV